MTRIEYERLSGITYEQELEILAEVYRLALESYRKRKKEAAEPVPEPDAAVRVEHEEEASDVEQRPDSQSEIVVTNSRKRTQ
jgi:hypothetical protein